MAFNKTYQKLCEKTGKMTNYEISKVPSARLSVKAKDLEAIFVKGEEEKEEGMEGKGFEETKCFVYNWETWGGFGDFEYSELSGDDSDDEDGGKGDHYFLEGGVGGDEEEVDEDNPLIMDVPLTSVSSLAKQLIQETITRNASPVLDGMVLPSTSSSSGGGGAGGGGGGDFGTSEISGALGLVDEAELMGLSKRGGVGGGGSGSGGGGSPHHHHSPHSSSFSYTVTLGDHSIKILGDDLQYVQEAKMALDDYFLQKYPDLFCANLNGIEEGEGDEDEEDDDDEYEDFQDGSSCQRYDRQTLLSLSKVRTPPPDFSHLEADVRGTIVLEVGKLIIWLIKYNC